MPAGHVVPKFGEVYKEILRRYLPQKIDADEENDDQSVVLMFRGTSFENNLTFIYNSTFWNLVKQFETNAIPRVWYYDEYAKEYFFSKNKTFLLIAGKNGSDY